jgi:hypothetical protein
LGVPKRRGTLRPRFCRADARSRKTKEVKVYGRDEISPRDWTQSSRRLTHHGLVTRKVGAVAELSREDEEDAEDDDAC